MPQPIFKWGSESIVVECDCGASLHVLKRNIYKAASGEVGVIPCPSCQAPLFNKIREVIEPQLPLPIQEEACGE